MGNAGACPYSGAVDSTPGPEPLSLFLVGLSEGIARSLARYVSGDPRVALANVAPSLELAGMLLPITQPDVVLLDWAVLNGSPADALRLLRAGRPGPALCLRGE